MLHFASFLRLKPLQFLLAAICIILAIPLSLTLIVLVPFLIQTLNSAPADMVWSTLIGEQISSFIKPFVKGTPFELGIPLGFQKAYLAQCIVVIAFLFMTFNFLSDYLLNEYTECIAKKLRADIAKKFLSLNYISAMRCDAGLLSSMTGSFINEIRQTFIRFTTSILKDGLSAIVFIIWLIFLDYRLFILLVVIVIPALLILVKTGRVLKRLAKQGVQIQSDLVRDILERMRGWQTIQIYKAVAFEIARFRKLNQQLFHNWRRSARAKALGSPLVEWFAIVSGCVIAVITLRRVYSGEVSTPILISFVITIGILGETIRNITNQIQSSKPGVESLRRILNFLKSDFTNRDIVNFDLTHPVSSPLEKIEISNLSIANLDKTVLLKNLSGLFQKGSFIVLVGPSGVGKTTFLNVLLGLLPAPEGEILLNHERANEEVYLKYASQIGFIPQEPHVFLGTVFDNIVYPQKITHPTQENVFNAHHALQLSNLTLDLQANVFGFSGGEKQRLMFARIFYNKPRFIIVDEGTSALDAQNENTILQTLKTTLHYSIIVMVSHRASVQKFATSIINFER